MPKQKEFSSEGFDLDNLKQATVEAGGGEDDDLVLELGGKVVPAAAADSHDKDDEAAKKKKDDDDAKAPLSPIQQAEDYKATGNAHFKRREWDEAYRMYSQAIQAVADGGFTPTGEELLEQQRIWQDEYNKKLRDEALRKNNNNSSNKSDKDDDDDDKTDDSTTVKKETFQAPHHPHGEKLAVYYSNRAAASLQLDLQEHGPTTSPPTASAFDDDEGRREGEEGGSSSSNSNPRLEEAIHDCSIAILLHPTYVKAWVRRSTLYERIHKTDMALEDAKHALTTLDPYNSSLRMSVARLQKIEDARLEQLKAETLDKLKDLGNSILGNFGLSLDNFQTNQDPNTGSYSISFNQNK